jgi:hypothetical protein
MFLFTQFFQQNPILLEQHPQIHLHFNGILCQGPFNIPPFYGNSVFLLKMI